ncbi:MAG: GrdX family protein [Firmicutes bacterium]|nr:GrdX family protein [Bacillota bacterium]MBQ2083825.1 GrdX family protein [Bacillota bacterium]
MAAKAEIISNNPDIEALVPKTFSFTGMAGSPAKAVLTAARDRIHLGAKLLAHPMAGRLRPNETPYMTVVLAPPAPSTGAGTDLDRPSLEIIEYCLAEEEKYINMRKKYDEPLLPDLRFISCELFTGILQELGIR